MFRAALCALLLLQASLGTSGEELAISQEPSVRLPPELARIRTDYEAAWRKGDGAALASLFDADGFVFSPGAPPVRGRAAIQRHYKGPGGPLFLRAFAFAAAGDIGYVLGGYTHAEGQPDAGKFTLVLHRAADGRWLIASDMDDGNAPSR